MKTVEIVPYKGNEGAVQTILKNGGVLKEEFLDEDSWRLRYTIEL